MAIVCSANLFGTSAQYIKTNAGDFIAVEGSAIKERLILSDLRIPYKQLLKSRVILRAGQVNYLLNHLGLGDNATFLAIKAVYNAKSITESDNYVVWSYSDDLTRVNYFADMMVLTGNSAHRIPQLYLTNPNVTYAVMLDVMVAVIDDVYSIFTDTLNQTGSSFTNLDLTDIHTYVVGESIVIKDKSTPVKPLVYITLNNINSITISGQILVIDDASLGSIFLQFSTQEGAYQAHSLLNYVLENPSTNIDLLDPLEDDVSPVVYFNSTAGTGGDWIAFNGATAGVPYNTSEGFTFSTSISLSTFGTTASGATAIDKSLLIDLLIDDIIDNRDGYMAMMESNVLIASTSSGITYSLISATGSYQVTYDFFDLAHNDLSGVFIDINITN